MNNIKDSIPFVILTLIIVIIVGMSIWFSLSAPCDVVINISSVRNLPARCLKMSIQ